MKIPQKPQLHPRNLHRGSYDFPILSTASPALAAFVRIGPRGQSTIDFANPAAVKALNQALLKAYYGLVWWDIPPDSLCPPIPGRADYIHYVADLISETAPSATQESTPRVLDIGVGANCIYPIIGHRSYGWHFVGSDISARSLAAAQKIVAANPVLGGAIELRLQAQPDDIFRGVIQAGEHFNLTICNPPFHTSAREARETNQRRLAKQGLDRPGSPLGSNFGGQNAELWCPGGEQSFIRRMIDQSRLFATQVDWFTTLISRRESLPDIYRQLKKKAATTVHTVPMAQGQKISRFVAWSFR